jgi:tetratricopeptide (TPR) repeat protein
MRTRILLTVALALFLAVPTLATPANLSGIRDMVDRGCYQEAVRDLTAIVEKDGEDHAAYALLGECEIFFQDFDAAENAISRALDLVEDKNPTYWKILGRVSFERGIQAYANRASANVIKSWFADSEVKFKRCLSLNPDDSEVRWWFGWAKEWQEYPIEARKAYDEQIARFPKAPGGYLRLASMLSQKANGTGNGFTEEAERLRAEAIKVFTTGNELAGPNAEILYGKGLALEWQRKGPDAFKCYQQAVAADPDFDKAWRRMYELKTDAATMISMAKKYPKSATASMWAAYYLAQAGKTREALNAVLPSLKEQGENWGAFQQAFAAAMKLLSSDAPTAIAALKTLNEVNEFNADAANNLGLYYRDTGKYEESKKWYLVAAERSPQSQDVLNDLALIYLFHNAGAEQKKCLPLLLKTVAMVEDDGFAPERGYWDALENLCKYYWEVDRQPEKVIRYADMRYKTTLGVAPYNMSGSALHYKKLAEKP